MDSGNTQKRQKTENIMNIIKETASELDCRVVELLAYLSMRNANIEGDFETGKIYKEIFQNGIDSTTTKISAEKALYLRYVQKLLKITCKAYFWANYFKC